MTKAEKRSLMKKIVERLEEIYPVAECALQYEGDPWRLLVMGRLSAQCTDKRVNEVSVELFEKFPTAKDMADWNSIQHFFLLNTAFKYIDRRSASKSC